ncbi:MAG: imidazolonepropionase, partial [Bacteroidota bacterium]
MKTLIKNIKKLVQVEDEIRPKVSGADMATLGTVDNAWLLIDNDRIEAFGTMDELQLSDLVMDGKIKEIDASGKLVFPSFVDSHTHLVYAGSREIEYIDKIKGLSYEEIAKRGGGILNSAKRLQEASEDELYEQAVLRINEIISQGTGAVEIKSGYGLNTKAELKMLRVIKRLKETMPVSIKSTFLGAHSVPA